VAKIGHEGMINGGSRGAAGKTLSANTARSVRLKGISPCEGKIVSKTEGVRVDDTKR